MSDAITWPDEMRFALAWGLEGALPVSSVPLTPADLTDGLTSSRYRQLLAARVEVMIEQSDDPREAIAELADEMECAGLWDGPRRFECTWVAVQELMMDNPVWPDFLSLQANLPDEQPFPIQHMPEAVDAIQATCLSEWIGSAFPGHSWRPAHGGYGWQDGEHELEGDPS